MSMNQYLEEMHEVLDKAIALPFAKGKCAVDIDRLRELIEDIKLSIPEEIDQAQRLLVNRDRILDQARTDADRMMEMAQERAKRILSSHEITRTAESRAKDLQIQSTNLSNEMRRATTDFIDNNLRLTEETLTKSLQEIKATRQAINRKK